MPRFLIPPLQHPPNPLNTLIEIPSATYPSLLPLFNSNINSLMNTHLLKKYTHGTEDPVIPHPQRMDSCDSDDNRASLLRARHSFNTVNTSGKSVRVVQLPVSQTEWLTPFLKVTQLVVVRAVTETQPESALFTTTHTVCCSFYICGLTFSLFCTNGFPPGLINFPGGEAFERQRHPSTSILLGN